MRPDGDHSNQSATHLTEPQGCPPYAFLLGEALACWIPERRAVMYVMEDDNAVFHRCTEFLRQMGRSFKTREEFARYAESEDWPGHECIRSRAAGGDRDHWSDEDGTHVSSR